MMEYIAFAIYRDTKCSSLFRTNPSEWFSSQTRLRSHSTTIRVDLIGCTHSKVWLQPILGSIVPHHCFPGCRKPEAVGPHKQHGQ